MVEAVTPPPAQGIVSTQMERVQNDKPAVAEAPPPREAPPPPPPPPPETGRGTAVDETA